MADNNELDLKHEINDNIDATVAITEDKTEFGVEYSISDATTLSMSKDNKGKTSAKLTIKI